MTRRDPFALPAVSHPTTATIAAAYRYVCDARDRETDARDIVKELVATHSAKLTYPTYRTALRCGDIYSEAATSCALSTARLLVDSFTNKARRYLDIARAGEEFQPELWTA